ncbi:MAG TPA: hypothetical protein VEK83_00430 [Gemmatimonadales bacterium]|nr:hypothetical protein [Gemmatimonadales bacterium]
MTDPNSAAPPPSDDVLPPSRVVRWLVLGGIILFSVALYFRFGLHTPHIGTVPTP